MIRGFSGRAHSTHFHRQQKYQLLPHIPEQELFFHLPPFLTNHHSARSKTMGQVNTHKVTDHHKTSQGEHGAAAAAEGPGTHASGHAHPAHAVVSNSGVTGRTRGKNSGRQLTVHISLGHSGPVSRGRKGRGRSKGGKKGKKGKKGKGKKGRRGGKKSRKGRGKKKRGGRGRKAGSRKAKKGKKKGGRTGRGKRSRAGSRSASRRRGRRSSAHDEEEGPTRRRRRRGSRAGKKSAKGRKSAPSRRRSRG